MFNLLKSDAYRMVRRADFWVYAAVAVGLMVLSAWMLSFFSSPEFARMVNENAVEYGQELTAEERAEIEQDLQEGLDEMGPLNDRVLPNVTYLWSQTFFGGGLLGILGSVLIAVFLSRDFKSGFVKNLMMDRRGRYVYYGEKLLLAAIVQAMFVALCALSSTLAFAAFGFTYEEASSVADVAIWLVLAWLVACAYAFLTACIVWLVRLEWLGVMWAVIVSSSMAGAFISQLALLFARAFPALEAFSHWTLCGSMATMSEGVPFLLTPNAAFPLPGLPPLGQVLLVCGLFLTVGIAVTFAACRRRDIK